METVDFEPRGTKIFFGELMIFNVDVLEMLKIPLEFSSKGCPREVISAARLQWIHIYFYFPFLPLFITL